METNLQEQQDQLRVYINDIEEHQKRNEAQTKRIKELETELDRLNNGQSTGFGVLMNTRNHKSQA